ncbi:MAG TPA: HAMP domain-containing sensor histidine kinase [Chloroflexota bacterium]|nr:HAMP domain-containing sensor histidine kinase [Chloroflexota bacterium]
MDGSDERTHENPGAPNSERLAALEARVTSLEAELAAAEARNRQLLARWEAWISVISHDLRGPLTLILGHAENIQHRLAKGKEAGRDRRGLNAIVAAARRLNKMLGQVVDGARLEIGGLASQPRAFDLPALIDEEVRRYHRIYPDRVVRVAAPAALPLALGDPHRVAGIVAQLLSNATIFSPGGGEIRVAGAADGALVLLTVCDAGIGLEAEDVGRLFEPFYRPERARPLPREGLGLSLALAREILRANGGDLTVTSPGPNLGACFTMSMPIATEVEEE